MMAAKQQNYLLLIAKSLTQNCEEKNYIISIENHNINNKINIQNTFAHNYEYIYKLWPCQDASRELVKITMYEKVINGKDTVFVKRGESTLLVKYSHQDERFQFYGSFGEKCVLVLKFRVEAKENIEEEINNGQLQRINRNLQKELKAHKDQSLNYKNYLDYTNRLIQTLSNHPLTQRKQGQIQTSISRINKTRTYSEPSVEQADQTNRKAQQVGSLYSPNAIQKNYSRDIYLNSAIDLNLVNLNSSRLIPSKHKQEVGIEEQNYNSPRNGKEQLQLNQRLKVSSEIKKRRQRYFDQTIQPIIERKSEQPAVLSFDVNNHNKKSITKSKTKTTQNQEAGRPFQFFQSFAKSKQQISKYSGIKIAQGKKYGSIRFKRAPKSQSKSGIQPSVQQQVETKSNNQQSEQNRGHSSFLRKVDDKTKSKNFNLTLSNFKAVLYAGNKNYPKKLIVYFQESRYSTQVNNCVNLATEWSQRFGIKNCQQNSNIYFKLISVGQKEKEEGEGQVVANDIILCSNKLYRSYFFVDDLAVGYLEFEFQVSQSSSAQEVQRKRSARNTISLPQLTMKNKLDSNSNRRSSLTKKQQQSRPFQRTTAKTNNKQLANRRSLGGVAYPDISQNKHNKVMNRIQEKKKLLKAKLK